MRSRKRILAEFNGATSGLIYLGILPPIRLLLEVELDTRDMIAGFLHGTEKALRKHKK